MSTRERLIPLILGVLLAASAVARAQESAPESPSRSVQEALQPVPAAGTDGPPPIATLGITSASRLDGPQPQTPYPALARRLGIQGKVTVRVLIDETGKARKANVIRREPFHIDLFDEVVRKNVMATRYAPALKDGKPVAAWYDAPFNFVLDGSDASTPKVIKLSEPVYPREGIEQGVEGWVSMLVELDEKGNTTAKQITVLNRFPLKFTYFDLKATEAVLASTFQPAGGLIARPSAILVRIDFRLPMN